MCAYELYFDKEDFFVFFFFSRVFFLSNSNLKQTFIVPIIVNLVMLDGRVLAGSEKGFISVYITFW